MLSVSIAPWIWTWISNLLGWTYFTAWSISFYPQLIQNYLTKSTEGLSIDYVVLNVLGHFSYTVFNLCFLLSSTIQKQYQLRHNGSLDLIRWNDGLFSLHAFVLAFLTWFQVFLYSPTTTLTFSSRRSIRWIFLLFFGSISIAILLLSLDLIQLLDLVILFSYIKLTITLIKYVPQILLNVSRKSTKGFTIHNVSLDLVGGILSLLQLGLDSLRQKGDFTLITGDMGKLGLSILSISFDVILMVQHYLVYPSNGIGIGSIANDDDDPERQLLLPPHVKNTSIPTL